MPGHVRTHSSPPTPVTSTRRSAPEPDDDKALDKAAEKAAEVQREPAQLADGVKVATKHMRRGSAPASLEALRDTDTATLPTGADAAEPTRTPSFGNGSVSSMFRADSFKALFAKRSSLAKKPVAPGLAFPRFMEDDISAEEEASQIVAAPARALVASKPQA